MNKRLKPNWETDNKEAWVQNILEFFTSIGYKNKRNKPESEYKVYSDVIKIKYNQLQSKNKFNYINVTMPYLDEEGKYKINQKAINLFYSMFSVALSGVDILIPINNSRSIYLKEDEKTGKSRATFDSKYSVNQIDTIGLECDEHATLREQLQLFEVLKPYVKCAIYSGGKSIHIWLATQNISTYNSPKNKVANKPEEWVDLHNKIEDICIDTIGIQLDGSSKCDRTVLHDYSRWLRLPFCSRYKKHHTRILYSNSNPVLLSNSNFYSYDEDINNDDLYIEDCVEEANKQTTTNTVITNGGTFEDSLPKIAPKTNYSYLKTIPNFFNNITKYISYMNSGLPSQGLRLNMYSDIVIANRILMGLDYSKIADNKPNNKTTTNTVITNGGTFEAFKAKCIEDVTRIIEMSSGRYEGTFEYAIEDFKRYFAKTKLLILPIRMPNVTTISSTKPLKAIEQGLNQLGIEEAKNIAKLINNVLNDKIKLLPAQCQKGNLGIHMNNEIRANINNKKTAKVMESLKKNNIMIKTKDYVNSSKTNRYWVNLPLILWLTTKAEEIDWDNNNTK